MEVRLQKGRTLMILVFHPTKKRAPNRAIVDRKPTRYDYRIVTKDDAYFEIDSWLSKNYAKYFYGSEVSLFSASCSFHVVCDSKTYARIVAGIRRISKHKVKVFRNVHERKS